MAYATYEYYVNSFYGDLLTADNFDRYAGRASDYLDYVTMGKAAAYDDSTGALAKACCACAEKFSASDAIFARVADGEVASESVGSHSVSYRSSGELQAAIGKELLSTVQMYLLPTGLLYRGAPCIRRIP